MSLLKSAAVAAAALIATAAFASTAHAAAPARVAVPDRTVTFVGSGPTSDAAIAAAEANAESYGCDPFGAPRTNQLPSGMWIAHVQADCETA